MHRQLLRTSPLALLLLSVACGPGTPAAPAPDANPARPEIGIDYDAKRVVSHDADGRVRWSTPLQGYLGLVRPPHLLWDANGVYVTHEDGITALDRHTGKPQWHAKGPNDRLCLSNGLLLAADCTSGAHIGAGGRWLTAWNVKDGKEAFRVVLPAKDFDPEPIREVAGLFLIQTSESVGGKGNALLIDREGQVVHRFDRQVIAGQRLGQDQVFLTSSNVVRVSSEGKRLWAVPFDQREWNAGGDIIILDDGQLLSFLYGRISDSGVQVMRIDPVTGKKVWSASCAPLGVGHSKYRHEATAAIEGDRLTVTSKGSYGTFVEVLDLRSGQRIKRTRASEP